MLVESLCYNLAANKLHRECNLFVVGSCVCHHNPQLTRQRIIFCSLNQELSTIAKASFGAFLFIDVP